MSTSGARIGSLGAAGLCAVIACQPALCAAQNGDAAEARRLLGEQRYTAALGEALRVSDPGERAFLEVQVRCDAGDFAGALFAARRGLELAPQHLSLLYYAADLALGMGAPELAQGPVRSLSAALVGSTLTDDVRASWLESAERLERELAAANDAALERARAARRARWIGATGALLALLVTLGLLAR